MNQDQKTAFDILLKTVMEQQVKIKELENIIAEKTKKDPQSSEIFYQLRKIHSVDKEHYLVCSFCHQRVTSSRYLDSLEIKVCSGKCVLSIEELLLKK
jgi:hypothetical protein